MKRFSTFVIFLCLIFLLASLAFPGQVFQLADLPSDPDQARQRISKWKNSGFIELVPRDPACLVLASPQFWNKLSFQEKAGVIRDCLYFGRFYNETYDTNYGGVIVFNRKNPAQELGWGNLKPGQIVIFH